MRLVEVPQVEREPRPIDLLTGKDTGRRVL
jgi:hypothetical protein